MGFTVPSPTFTMTSPDLLERVLMRDMRPVCSSSRMNGQVRYVFLRCTSRLALAKDHDSLYDVIIGSDVKK